MSRFFLPIVQEFNCLETNLPITQFPNQPITQSSTLNLYIQNKQLKTRLQTQKEIPPCAWPKIIFSVPAIIIAGGFISCIKQVVNPEA